MSTEFGYVYGADECQDDIIYIDRCCGPECEDRVRVQLTIDNRSEPWIRLNRQGAKELIKKLNQVFG